MKMVQVTLDERLLEQLDRDEEVRRDGRSAVIRRATYAYLRSKKRQEIAEAYRRGYATGADELQGWSGEGVWPDD